MVTIDPQDVFNKVIEKGFYDRNSLYMCCCLNAAMALSAITYNEFCVGTSAAMGYVTYLNSLTGEEHDNLIHALESASRKMTNSGDTFSIYTDWANRPMFEDINNG